MSPAGRCARWRLRLQFQTDKKNVFARSTGTVAAWRRCCSRPSNERETGAANVANAKVPQHDDRPSNLQKNPDDWTTGDEPMTDAQASYLKTLSEEAGEAEAFDFKLTKAEASKRIDSLQRRTGRGR
ncbi:MAG: DUF3072 domain-containing protein [Rhodospirillales bacterium]|nr:DUF3072 domain-containing protein [Rhodospirillales bacterium]